MGCKVPGSSAPGYWGRNPAQRIAAEEVPEKIIALLQDKLVAMGRPAWLYLPVEPSYPGAVACSCAKETQPASDDRCFSCYGTTRIPGYTKFLHNDVFFSSAEEANYTLVGCSLDLRIKPNRILMDAGTTTATIVTDDKPFVNPNSDTWDVELRSFLRATGNAVTAEFSTDAGANYYPASTINGVNQPTGTGTLRFRVTLSRTLATDKTPAFEILRARHLRSADVNQNIVQARAFNNSMQAGQILIARTWVIERTIRAESRGRTTDHSGDKAWTAPLNFFDLGIGRDTPAARVTDREEGPHPFYEVGYGVDLGQRYAIHTEHYSQELLTLTHQLFGDRRIQDGENYRLVF